MMIGMANGLLDCDIEVGVEKRVGTITINGVTYDRYVKIVDCGALPNSAGAIQTVSVNHDINGIVGVLSLSGIAFSSNMDSYCLPYANVIHNESITLRVRYGNLQDIAMYVVGQWSNYKALITVEYYK